MEISDRDAIRPLAMVIKSYLGGGEFDMELIRALLSGAPPEEFSELDDKPAVVAWPLEPGQRAAVAIAGDRLIYAEVGFEDHAAVFRRSDVAAVVAREIDTAGQTYSWSARRWEILLPDRKIDVVGLTGWDQHDRVATFMRSLIS